MRYPIYTSAKADLHTSTLGLRFSVGSILISKGLPIHSFGWVYLLSQILLRDLNLNNLMINNLPNKSVRVTQFGNLNSGSASNSRLLTVSLYPISFP